MKNSFEEVVQLIDGGADVNAVLAHGWSVLHWSMRDRNIKVTELLILKGANVNAKTSGGNTPLHLAVFNASPQSCQLLLKNNADVNAGDVDGDTPLHVAALKNCTEAGASLLAVTIFWIDIMLSQPPSNSSSYLVTPVWYQRQST